MVSGAGAVVSLRLTDLQGRIVAEQVPRDAWSGQATLSVTGIPRGVYHLRVERDGGATTIAVRAP